MPSFSSPAFLAVDALRRPALAALYTALFLGSGACGKARQCDRLAERNQAAAAAIEGAILDDYAQFAAYTRAKMRRTPPAEVEARARASATQWRSMLTDPGLASACRTEWPDLQVEALAQCLDRPDDADYAVCVLGSLGVPRLGAELGGPVSAPPG